MIGLLQRVVEAQVFVENQKIGEIGRGLVVFVGVQTDDTRAKADRLLERLIGYRVFPDAAGRMNRCLLEVDAQLLLVPQFTLPADTRKGNRPSFTPAAAPELAAPLFDHVVERARERVATVATGIFGADMQVRLINDGPVTFWLET